MSALAQQHGAVNLGQGFPDFDCDPALLDAVTKAMHSGAQPVPADGRRAGAAQTIVAKIEALYGHRYDAGSEITVTAGATQAIITAILAIVHPGDEVIVLEPLLRQLRAQHRAGRRRAVHVPLTPGSFRPDFGASRRPSRRARARSSSTRRTTRARPCGRRADMQRLAELLRPTDVLVIADEVYEHMVYDEARHESMARHPELAQRAFIVSSFGKTYHVTGWKIGYVAAPAALTAEFRKVHQFNVFTVNTPMQHGLGRLHGRCPHHLGLPAFYQRKRDLFRAGLAGSRFRLLPSEGSYFQCVDYSAISEEPEESFCRRLTTRDRRGGDPAVGLLPGAASSSASCASASPRRTRRSPLALQRLAAL